MSEQGQVKTAKTGKKNRYQFNSLTAKSVLAGEKLVATYSIST